jgi:hypothetical protein
VPRLLSKRLILCCIALVGFGVAIIGWIVLQQIEPAESRSEVVVAVKADGSFYLPSEPTTPLTREVLKKLFHTANPPHCVIALDNSCPVNVLGPVITAAAEAGFARYQLRTPEYRLNVSLEECDYYCGFNSNSPLQQWVDLRESATDRIIEAPDRPEQSDDVETSTEIAILTDPDLPTGELLKASVPYTALSKSMKIYVLNRYLDGELQLPTLELYRHRFEDEAHRYIPPPPGPLAEKATQWWNTLKDTVNSWF